MSAARAAEVDAWARANDVALPVLPRGGEDARRRARSRGRRLPAHGRPRRSSRRAASGGVGGCRSPVPPGRSRRAAHDRPRRATAQTRFYADPRFPDERCDDLYDVWITRSAEGWADAVLVAEHDGRPAGYVSCHADAGAGRGSIGLIAVAEPGPRAPVSGRRSSGARSAGATSTRPGGDRRRHAGPERRRAAASTSAAGSRSSRSGFWFHRWYADEHAVADPVQQGEPDAGDELDLIRRGGRGRPHLRRRAVHAPLRGRARGDRRRASARCSRPRARTRSSWPRCCSTSGPATRSIVPSFTFVSTGDRLRAARRAASSSPTSGRTRSTSTRPLLEDARRPSGRARSCPSTTPASRASWTRSSTLAGRRRRRGGRGQRARASSAPTGAGRSAPSARSRRRASTRRRTSPAARAAR